MPGKGMIKTSAGTDLMTTWTTLVMRSVPAEVLMKPACLPDRSSPDRALCRNRSGQEQGLQRQAAKCSSFCQASRQVCGHGPHDHVVLSSVPAEVLMIPLPSIKVPWSCQCQCGVSAIQSESLINVSLGVVHLRHHGGSAEAKR